MTITNALLQQAIDYTPWEGTTVTGWPVMTFLRGRRVMVEGRVDAEAGTGEFLPRGSYDFIKPSGMLTDGCDAASLLSKDNFRARKRQAPIGLNVEYQVAVADR